MSEAIKNSDMPAMPNITPDMNLGEHGGPGLSKREEAAFRAMQGAWWELTDAARPQHFEGAAKLCIQMADALLAELERTK